MAILVKRIHIEKGKLPFILLVRIGECQSNSPFLKNNGAEAHCF